MVSGNTSTKSNLFSKAMQASETNSPKMSPCQQGLETKKNHFSHINTNTIVTKSDHSGTKKVENKLQEFTNNGWNLKNKIKNRITIGTTKANEPIQSRYYNTNPKATMRSSFPNKHPATPELER